MDCLPGNGQVRSPWFRVQGLRCQLRTFLLLRACLTLYHAAPQDYLRRDAQCCGVRSSTDVGRICSLAKVGAAQGLGSRAMLMVPRTAAGSGRVRCVCSVVASMDARAPSLPWPDRVQSPLPHVLGAR